MLHTRCVITAVGLTAMLAGCGGGSPSPAGSEQVSTTPPATGGATVLADLTKDWTDQKDTMLKAADAMPDDKFGYKSTPAQRSYGEQVMHIALVNVDLLKVVGGSLGGNVTPPSFTAESVKTKADMLKALGDSYDYGLALLRERTDATITSTIDAAFLGPSTRGRVFWVLLAHSMDVYGQMVVYLRLNGVVPPASRGL